MRQYHLWRNFPQRPRRRFVCTIEEDTSVHGGYLISRSDQKTATISFLQTLQTHFGRPVRAMTRARPKEGCATDGIVILYPGDKDYFDVAVRQVPAVTIGAAP